MNDQQRLVLISGILNSALYLTAIFVAGIVTGDKLAWILAIVTMGVVYVAVLWQMMLPTDRLGAAIWLALSVVLGFAAGLAVIWGAL